jgi:hypothetical protein
VLDAPQGSALWHRSLQTGMDKLGRFRHEGRDEALEFAAACAIGKVEQFQWCFPIP